MIMDAAGPSFNLDSDVLYRDVDEKNLLIKMLKNFLKCSKLVKRHCLMDVELILSYQQCAGC